MRWSRLEAILTRELEPRLGLGDELHALAFRVHPEARGGARRVSPQVASGGEGPHPDRNDGCHVGITRVTSVAASARERRGAVLLTAASDVSPDALHELREASHP